MCVCVCLSLFLSTFVCVSLQMYNLSNELASSDFTLLLPTDEAVQKYLSRTNSSLLVGPREKIDRPENIAFFSQK